MTVDYEMPLGPLGGIIDKLKFAKSAEKGMENALYNVTVSYTHLTLPTSDLV